MDGFRAFAIAGIVVFHLITSTTPIGKDPGGVLLWGTLPNLVDALFIVSGFVVFLPTVARAGEFGGVGAFARRRAARLVPAYWLALLIAILLLALWPLSPQPDLPGIGSIGTHVTMLQMPAQFVDPGFLLGFGIAGPVWTLSIEAAFYLLLPLVAGIYFRHPLLGLAAAALITLAWKVGLENLPQIAELLGMQPSPQRIAELRNVGDSQFPAWVFSFALGMTGAWVYQRLREGGNADGGGGALRRRGGLVQLASLASLAVSAYLIGRYALTIEFLPHSIARREPLLSLAFSASLAAFMVSTALCASPRQVPFSLPAARSLADISYGIYLIHLPLIFFVGALIVRWEEPLGLSGLVDSVGALPILALTVLPLAVLYGWASARYLEQPIRRWAHRFGRRAESGVPPVSTPARETGAG